MMARFAQIWISTNPERVETVLCDQFEVDDDGGILVYYDGELWAYFKEVEYVTVIDEEVNEQLERDYADPDDDDDDDDEPEAESSAVVDLVVAEESLSDLSHANGGVEVDADSR